MSEATIPSFLRAALADAELHGDPLVHARAADVRDYIRAVEQLEAELQAAHGEAAIAYGVIDDLPEGALDKVPSAKLLSAVRVMEEAEKRAMAETGLQRQVVLLQRENDLVKRVLTAAGERFAAGDQEGVRLLLCDTNAREHGAALLREGMRREGATPPP